MSNHTPGPWTYSYTSAAAARAAAKDGTDGGGGNGLIMARQPGPGQDPTIVAILPYHRDPSEDQEREANACLLAAGPEMVDSLRDAVMLMQFRAKNEGPLIEPEREWLNTAAALLNRVEGERQ